MKILEGKKVYTIAEVNYFAKQTLEELAFWVEGEVSTIQSNTKWFNDFITLKDENDILPCFMESIQFQSVDSVKVGDIVQVQGFLTLFKKNEYKFRILNLISSGEGILQKKYKQLYEKLKKEGLFNEEYKKDLPTYPRKVCLLSSKGSAGWHDFKSKTIDLFPIIELATKDINVGGVKAVEDLLRLLPKIDNESFDVVVITRGGGSEESLLEVFNDERVVRAIFNMCTPKIVAIGHEINIALSELVADQRASTPTDAANLITSGYLNLTESLPIYKKRLTYIAKNIFSEQEQALDVIYSRLIHSTNLFLEADQACNLLLKNLIKNVKQIKSTNAQRLDMLGRAIVLLSPENTLNRGYSITYNGMGKIIRNVEKVELGTSVKVKLANGSFKSLVKSKQKDG